MEGANLKLSSVVTDVTGVSARRILEAIVQDRFAPEQLSELVHGSLRDKRPQWQAALVGRVRAHPRFLLAQPLVPLDFCPKGIFRLDEPIATYSQEIERLTQPLEELVPLLDTIPGVARTTAELILAEVGAEVSRFPSAAHLAAWAGLAPGNHESAGKRLSGHTRQGSQ
jgi:transposase